MNIHTSFGYNNQKLEINQIFTNLYLDKPIMEHRNITLQQKAFIYWSCNNEESQITCERRHTNVHTVWFYLDSILENENKDTVTESRSVITRFVRDEKNYNWQEEASGMVHGCRFYEHICMLKFNTLYNIKHMWFITYQLYLIKISSKKNQ